MNKTGNPKLTRSYHIPLAMFDDAFRAFQKKYVYPMNIVITVILLAIAGVYVHAAVKDNTQTLAYLLIVICIALILVRWYRVFKLRRAVHEALKEIESDTYEVSIYDEGLVIRTEEAPEVSEADVPAQEDSPAEEPPSPAPSPAAETAQNSEKPENGFHQLFPEAPAEKEPVPATEIPFGSGVKIHEFDAYFMVYIVKQNFYVIPKKDFSGDEIAEMKKIFGLQ